MTDYREGYSDAKTLIESLDNLSLARMAVPPAMSEDYKSGFAKACDDAEQRHRPNSNYILSVMRDGDMDDPWGTAMSMAFAVAECLAVIGAEVPAELGFQPSPYVRLSTPEEYSEIIKSGQESYEHSLVWEYLGWDTGLILSRVEEVQFAGRCLHRYIDWCKAAGLDY